MLMSDMSPRHDPESFQPYGVFTEEMKYAIDSYLDLLLPGSPIGHLEIKQPDMPDYLRHKREDRNELYENIVRLAAEERARAKDTEQRLELDSVITDVLTGFERINNVPSIDRIHGDIHRRTVEIEQAAQDLQNPDF